MKILGISAGTLNGSAVSSSTATLSRYSDDYAYYTNRLASGNLFVKRFFAKRVLANRDDPLPGKRIERMISIKFGDAVGIVSLPAEPFMEIGIAIKKTSRFPYTMVAALGMGTVGYVAMPENYERGGGYETRPSPSAPAHDVAPKIIEKAIELLK